MLVSYYLEEVESIVVKHYEPIQLVQGNAESVHEADLQAFGREEILLTNVISILSDSASCMRGKTSGFETFLKVEPLSQLSSLHVFVRFWGEREARRW